MPQMKCIKIGIQETNRKMKTYLVAASLLLVVVLCGACAESERLDGMRERLEAIERRLAVKAEHQLASRVVALEEKLKEFETEVRTKRLVAETAVFTGERYGSTLEISPMAVMIYSAGKDDRNASGTIAKYGSDELYIQDFLAFRSSGPNGRSISMDLWRAGSNSPEIRMWHYDESKRAQRFDKKLSSLVESRSEVYFDERLIGKSEDFQFIDTDYGPIIIRASELKVVGSEVVLKIQIATASAVPLSGLKGAIGYRVETPGDSIGAKQTRSFLLERRMESGVFYSVSVPLGIPRAQLGMVIWLSDVQILGAYLRSQN
jgi:hypothetical protein